jgi:hypothetical protein
MRRERERERERERDNVTERAKGGERERDRRERRNRWWVALLVGVGGNGRQSALLVCTDGWAVGGDGGMRFRI